MYPKCAGECEYIRDVPGSGLDQMENLDRENRLNPTHSKRPDINYATFSMRKKSQKTGPSCF